MNRGLLPVGLEISRTQSHASTPIDKIWQVLKFMIWFVSCLQHKSGWFSEALLDTLRLRVAVRFVSVFPEPGFEDVFKSIQEEFERSEKVQSQKETLKPSLVKHREATKSKIIKKIVCISLLAFRSLVSAFWYAFAFVEYYSELIKSLTETQ